MKGAFHRLARALAGTAAALVLASGAQAAMPQDEGVETVRAEPKVQPLLAAPPAARAHANLQRALRVVLVAPAKRLEAQSADAVGPGAPLQIGYPRAVPALASSREVARSLDWQSASGSKVAAISLSSSGASGLRAGLRIEALPAEAVLHFYAPGSPDVIAVTAAEVQQTLERNIAAGDASESARTFWSPVVEGETLVIEVEVAADTPAEAVGISIPVLSHLAASPRDAFVKATASSCELDAMCYQSTWGNESNAVSRIVFTDAGSSFVCTGTLLADRDTSSLIPYFLTANHCVSTQTIASTVQNYWLWRSAACDSGTRGASQTTFGGGTLLYATGTTDTSFLRLNTAPPAGTTYAGWIASAPSQGASVTGLHHPAGDLEKISFGNVASFWNCQATKAGQFSCSGATPTAATFLGVSWRSGITEGGSSGSPLFTDNGHYLVGQLYGGNGSCSAPGTDFYGRFDLAYGAGLSQWLGTPSGGVTPAADYTDLWWNAGESGWGLSLTQHEGALFAAWFVYEANGKPTWFVMPGGTWTSSNTFTGDIYSATGPDPMAAGFDPTRVVRTRVGSGTLRFPSSTQGSFSYSVNGVSESRAITRQPFGNGAATVVGGFGDLWWTAAESGWGLSLHQQGSSLFGVWYTYAPDGSPTWYVMPSGNWTSADTFTGDLYRATSSGGFFGRSFNAAGVTRTDVGSLTLRFNGTSSAAMTYAVDGITGTKQITRQPF